MEMYTLMDYCNGENNGDGKRAEELEDYRRVEMTWGPLTRSDEKSRPRATLFCPMVESF